MFAFDICLSLGSFNKMQFELKGIFFKSCICNFVEKSLVKWFSVVSCLIRE